MLATSRQPIDLVLVDVVMPDVGGVALARLICEEWPLVRILFMSAFPAEILVREGLDHPSVSFLAKPFTRSELMDKIVTALRGHPGHDVKPSRTHSPRADSGLCLRMPPDAVVVGSGPNGLAAAIVLAQAGIKTLLREAAPTLGGGLRSAELTLPGFTHDVCSAVHPLAISSPFFRGLPVGLARSRVGSAPAPLAHPLDDGTAARARAIDRGHRGGLGAAGPRLAAGCTAVRRGLERARRGRARAAAPASPAPLLMARFGLQAIRPAASVARGLRGDAAQALFAGNAAHSFLALEARGRPPSGSCSPWRGTRWAGRSRAGGSQRLADALVAHFRSLGGEVRSTRRSTLLDELRGARDRDARPGPAPGGPARRRLGCPRGYRGRSSATATARRRSSSTGRSTAPCPGRRPSAPARPPCTWAARSRRSPPPRRRTSEARSTSARSSSSSQPTLFDPTRAPAGRHTPGPTATSPTAATWT